MCDHCEVPEKPVKPVKKTKRAEYLAAKELVSKLEKEVLQLSNRLFNDIEKAQSAACDPIRKALLDAQTGAIDKFKAEHAAEYAQLEELRLQSTEARHRFASYEYDCNHQDENGVSAVAPRWSFGCDPGDKPTMVCSICGETWK